MNRLNSRMEKRVKNQTKNHCVTCKYKLSELKTGLNPEISTPLHIRVKLMKSTDQKKKKILNASREK